MIYPANVYSFNGIKEIMSGEFNPIVSLDLTAYEIMMLVHSLEFQSEVVAVEAQKNPVGHFASIQNEISRENKELREKLLFLIKQNCPWVLPVSF